jgi:hypothetical protein
MKLCPLSPLGVTPVTSPQSKSNNHSLVVIAANRQLPSRQLHLSRKIPHTCEDLRRHYARQLRFSPTSLRLRSLVPVRIFTLLTKVVAFASLSLIQVTHGIGSAPSYRGNSHERIYQAGNRFALRSLAS